MVSNERGLNKEINVFNLHGELLENFDSGINLSKWINVNRHEISRILSNRLLYCNGFIILFSNDNLTIEDIKNAQLKVQKKQTKCVYLYDLEQNLIAKFQSAKACAEFIGCKIPEIRMCCLGRRSRIKKFKTKYEEISKEIQ